MEENEKALVAKGDAILREQMLQEYSLYICKCASKAAGKYIDKSNDLYSEALTGFNDAISAYSIDRGSFLAFASKVIRNRVIDYIRKERKHSVAIPMSSMSRSNSDGEDVEFDIEDKSNVVSDATIEIYSLRSELEKYEISFFDLPKESPKTKKTIVACVAAAKYVVENKMLLQYVYSTKHLPSKQLIETLKINKKVTERYRKYIIMGVLILAGNYEIMSDYFLNGKKVCG